MTTNTILIKRGEAPKFYRLHLIGPLCVTSSHQAYLIHILIYG